MIRNQQAGGSNPSSGSLKRYFFDFSPDSYMNLSCVLYTHTCQYSTDLYPARCRHGLLAFRRGALRGANTLPILYLCGQLSDGGFWHWCHAGGRSRGMARNHPANLSGCLGLARPHPRSPAAWRTVRSVVPNCSARRAAVFEEGKFFPPATVYWLPRSPPCSFFISRYSFPM